MKKSPTIRSDVYQEFSMFIKNFQKFQRIVWNNLKCVLTLFWSHCEIRGPPLIWGPILGGRHQFWDPLWGAPSITGPVIGVINFGSILKACHLLCVNAYFRTTLSGNGLQFGSFGHQGRRRRQQQQQLRSQEPFSQNLRAKTSQVFLRTKVRFLFYCLRLYYDSIFFF